MVLTRNHIKLKRSFISGGVVYCRIEEGPNAGQEVKLFRMRGWGMLTGVGGYHLSEDKAAEIQDTFADYCVEMLNKK